MASAYLTDILTYEGTFPTDVNFQTKQLIQQSKLLKTFVKTTLENGKIDFQQLSNDNKRLTTGANDLIEEINNLQDKINTVIKPELSLCLRQLEELSSSLQEINIISRIFFQLSEMHSIISNAEAKLKNREYFECAKYIKEYQNAKKNEDPDLKNVDLNKSLSNEADECQRKLLDEMSTLWALFLKFDTEILDDVKVTKFHIKLDSMEEIIDIVKAADWLEYTAIEEDFVNKVLTRLANEVIMHKVLARELAYGNKILNLEILHTTTRPSYIEVFTNLRKVMGFLVQNLNVDIREDLKFLKKIGSRLGIPLIESLVENYLVKMIPSSTIELENYHVIMNLAEQFDIYLKEHGFLPETNKSVSDHKAKVNDLFVERFSGTYLERARVIMKKDMNKKMYGDDLVITSLDKLPEDCMDILQNKMNIKTPSYVYPKTQVSNFTKELTNLMKHIMLETMRSKDCCSVPMLQNLVDICELYGAVVPLNHKDSADLFPLKAGLFHNNCLYLAYTLINLVSEFYERLSPTLYQHFHKLFRTAASLRAVAKEKFEEHVTFQKNNFVDVIQKSGLGNIEENTLNFEGTVRQCMRQLDIMETSWKDLLPLKVYHRAMGFLLDSVIDEFISLIMRLEDIPYKTATSLASVLGIIIEKGPPLFMDPKEIFKHSAKWLKLKEFVLVLQGSLKDIDDRWSNGLGPLASEFTPEQVKHLIRALFQNSERRSELLNRIK